MTRSLAGILALQGGFEAHEQMLNRVGFDVREVRVPSDLDGLDVLVLPGGESTTMMLGIAREGFAEPLVEFIDSGKPALATCAGAILLSRSHLGVLDIACDRNAYGGQVHSFEADLDVAGLSANGAAPAPFRGVFIRAPRMTATGAQVETLASFDGDPVVVRSGAVTALTFHPELTDDPRLHELALGTPATTE